MNKSYIVQCANRSPVGTRASMTAASIRAGISRLMKHPDFEDKMWNRITVGLAAFADPDLMYIDRLLELTIPALKDVILPLETFQEKISPIPLIIGLPEARPGLPEDLKQTIKTSISDLEKEIKTKFVVEFIAKGHSSGLIAMEAAVEKIDNEETDFCLIGGIDSYVEEETLSWLEENGRLYGSGKKTGFIPGEAAGFCLLASQKAVKKYNMIILAKITGVSSTYEKNSYDSGKICTGDGLTQVISKAAEDMPDGQPFHQLFSTLNGERYHNSEFGYAAARLGKFILNVGDVVAPVNCWGDLGAASAPLLISLATESGRKGYAPGPFSLIFTSSLGTSRAGAVLELNIQKRKRLLWAK